MEKTNIEMLKEITNNLPPLTSFIKEKNFGMIQYSLTEGTCLGFNLYNVESISVQRAFLSKGACFPKHKHEDSVELVIVYEGALKSINNGIETVLKVGDFVYSQKGDEHCVEALEDSWVIAITIPRDKGYPNGD